MRNYLKSPNPFQLSAPPKWWLQEMYAFDSELVIFPSQQDAVFRLARRAKLSAPLLSSDVPQVKDFLPTPDTLFMAEAGVVPVTTLFPFSGWTSRTFQELARRDIWREGGAEKVADRLDEQNAAARDRQRRNIREDCAEVARDIYRSYKRRTGERFSVGHKKRPPASAVPQAARSRQTAQPLISTPAA